MSIGLSEHTILTYKTEDLEIQLTAVGNINSIGNTKFYFGDYTTMSNKYLIPYEFGIKIINADNLLYTSLNESEFIIKKILENK